MSSVMSMTSINIPSSMHQKNAKNRVNGIYVSYAIVIGIHRIILFDHLNNVQGFIFNGCVLSVEEAGPQLSASILEPLRVPSHSTYNNNSSMSPASSAFSGTTISSDTNNQCNDVDPNELNEESPDPPPSLLLSAPEYIPAQSAKKCTENTSPNDNMEEAEEQKEEETNIVSIVGDRVVLIPSLQSIKTQISSSKTPIQYSYNFLKKSNIRRQCSLKRSRTTFESKPRRRITKRRSVSCGTLSVVRE